MKTIAQMIIALVMLGAVASCTKYELQNIESQKAVDPVNTQARAQADQGEKQLSWLEQAEVYYDFYNYSVQLKRVVDEPVYNNPSFKVEPGVLYVYDVRSTSPVWQGRAFVAVSSAKVAPEATMLWTKVLVRFNQGNAPHQFYSANDLLAATNGPHPSVSLIPTGVVYQGRLITVGETKMPNALKASN